MMTTILSAALAPDTSGTCTAAARKTGVVWSEGTAPQQVYPHDINGAIAAGLRASEVLQAWDVTVANIGEPEQGLPSAVLSKADVLVWWGHEKHAEVTDELAARIAKRVKDEGMGFIALHSAHFSKPNKLLMGTACSFAAYLCDNKETVIQVTAADHPIANGVAAEFTIANDERYSDPYAVPPAAATPFGGTTCTTTECGRKASRATVGRWARAIVSISRPDTRPARSISIRRSVKSWPTP